MKELQFEIKVREYLSEAKYKTWLDRKVKEIDIVFGGNESIRKEMLKRLALKNRAKVTKHVSLSLLKSNKTIKEICEELEIDFKDKDSVSALESLRLVYT